MSSTNRSKARDVHANDFYVTPITDIVQFLQEMNRQIEVDMSGCILDPAAGGSRTDKTMSYPAAIAQTYSVPIEHIHTIDIREDSLADTKCDYLTTKLNYKPDVIITNPPFRYALEFVQKALEDVKDGGYVIMLLRLNFLETKARKAFFDDYMPEYIFVHHKRMSFTADGKTDSVAYAHYVWRKGFYPKFAKIKVI